MDRWKSQQKNHSPSVCFHGGSGAQRCKIQCLVNMIEETSNHISMLSIDLFLDCDCPWALQNPYGRRIIVYCWTHLDFMEGGERCRWPHWCLLVLTEGPLSYCSCCWVRLAAMDMLQMKGIIEMLYGTGDHMFWGYSSLTTHVDGAFLLLAKSEGFSYILFFFLNTDSVFSAPSSHWCCRRLQLLSSQASLGNTSYIAVSLNDIQQRYLFPQQDLFGSFPGLCLFPVLLEFSWRSHFSWLPAFTALTWAAHSQVHLPTQRAASHSFPISSLKELGFVYHFVPSLSNIYWLMGVSW